VGLSIGIGGDIEYYERDADNECEPAALEKAAQSAREHDLHRQSERASDYYSGDVQSGRELAGRWRGVGAQNLALQGKVTSWQLHTLYGEHTDPVTGALLGSRPRQYRTPEERRAQRLAQEPYATAERRREIELSVSETTQHNRNFFDLTFSLPKSYSLLYVALLAAGREEDARKLLDAHHYAIDQAMTVMMAEAGTSRKGHHGRPVTGRTSGEFVGGHNWVYSFFDHRTSRCGDPQLHTHVLVNNKVLCDDGVWRTLDSRAMFKMSRSIGALHERFMAEESSRTLGVRHRPRVDGYGWEVEGITQEEIDQFSSRRRAIKPEAEQLMALFRHKFGREPSAREIERIMDAAARATRPVKNHELTFDQYMARWLDQYHAEHGQQLVQMLERVPMGHQYPEDLHISGDRSAVLQMAVACCERKYPTWGRPQLRQALSDVLPPYLGCAHAEELLPYLDALVDEAIRSEQVVMLSQPAAVDAPASRRFDNGRSIYEPYHVERFTTRARLSSENILAELAALTNGPRLTPADAQRLIDETTLYPDQASVVRDVLTSGRRLTRIEAWAATGKTYTEGQLSRLWYLAFGEHPVGLTKNNNAANVLADSGVKRSMNFDRFRTAHEVLAQGAVRSPKVLQTMQERYGVTPRTLLIVDEISTLNDEERFWLARFAREHHAPMVWVGDRGQVGAIGADAALDVLDRIVPPLTLEHARRFRHEWEGPASFGLHDGELAAIAQYETHGRIISGTREQMNHKSIDYLVADLLRGYNSLLMVATVELADEFSSHVRQRLIDLGHVDAGRSVRLHNNTYASCGDLIQARLTTRDLPGRPPAEASISNRDLFSITTVRADGSLVVRQHIGHNGTEPILGPSRSLPAEYVHDYVELGYVTTVHSKIGRTVWNSYNLVTNSSTWPVIYTALTRGANLNIIFVPVEHDDKGVAIETGAEVMARIAADHRRMLSDPDAASATERQRQELDAVTHMARIAPIYDNELLRQTQAVYQELFERVLSPEHAAALAHDQATPALYRLTHALQREGHDVEQVVRDAVHRRELDSAQSVAEVLHWRISSEVGPPAPKDITFTRTRYADQVPAGDTPEHDYLRRLAEVMDRRVDDLSARQVQNPEPWALRYLGDVPDDPIQRITWSDRAGRVAAYREQYGVSTPEDAIGEAPGRSAVEQRAAWEESYVALGRPAAHDDVARLGDGELLLAINQYHRIQAWMPPDVSDRLATTLAAAREYDTQAALDKARGDLDTASRAERIAARLTQQASALEEIHSARRRAEEATAEQRHQANLAQVEYDRRHPTVGADEEHQTTSAQQPHRSFTLEDALTRVRQVTRELDAERQAQQEREQQQMHGYDPHRHDLSAEHGYDI
jgi:conjugative relaxase-like TrwC/TraI family protein